MHFCSCYDASKNRIIVPTKYKRFLFGFSIIFTLVIVSGFFFHLGRHINFYQSVDDNQVEFEKNFYKSKSKSIEMRPPIITEPPSARNIPFKNLYDVVSYWNPDEPTPPSTFKETIQHFDYGNLTERSFAEKFRNAEIPFKLFNVSEFDQVSSLWTDQYLIKRMTFTTSRIEKSISNHFMFWSFDGSGRIDNYKTPTKVVYDMDFESWLNRAKDADTKKISNASEHFYYMTGTDKRDKGNGRSFVAKDLKLFSTSKPNFFITNVPANKGIQCRFGMRGVIAEAHYDSGRNMVAMLKGEKRYILNPPWACKYLSIIRDKRHPSFRHSTIDWSNLNEAELNSFDKVDAIDTIVRRGEVLYIPSYWFHYIVSLEYSIQCNSRSGSPPHEEGFLYIKSCMNIT